MLKPRCQRPAAACIAALLLLTAAMGCTDDAGGRIGFEGRVTVDGNPLEKGSISFRPMKGTSGPTAGGSIIDGKFAIEPKDSLFPGSYRVEIRASRKTGKKVKDHTFGTMVDHWEQYLPEKYNRQSTLTAEVNPGMEMLEFSLSLK